MIVGYIRMCTQAEDRDREKALHQWGAEKLYWEKDSSRSWVRPAYEEMAATLQPGDTVVVISATFEPIILRAMERHPFDNQISTRMSVATDGTYTRAVEGLPVEGEEKLAAVRRFGTGRTVRRSNRAAGSHSPSTGSSHDDSSGA